MSDHHDVVKRKERELMIIIMITEAETKLSSTKYEYNSYAALNADDNYLYLKLFLKSD